MTDGDRRRRHLVVVSDDEAVVSPLVSLSSERDDLLVTVVPSPADLFARVGDGPVDCLVCDHRPPAIDGLATVRRVRHRWPSIPTVLVPDRTDGDTASEAVDVGVSAFLPRDSEGFPRLVERIRRLLDGMSVEPGRGLPIEDLPPATERRVKEQAMDAAPVGILITDPAQDDNPIVYANRSFERLTGYPATEIVGRNCRFLQGPATDQSTRRAMREAIDEERPVTVELVNYRKSGESFWNKVDIAPVEDPSGSLTHFVGFQTDVTARREAEDALARERASLEHLLDRINGLVRDVTETVIRAASREAIESSVGDRLAAEDSFSAVWFVEPEPGTDELAVRRVIPSSVDTPSVESALDPALRDEVGRATEGGGARIVESTSLTPSADSDERTDVAVVPLSYRDTAYGAMGVVGTGPGVMSEHETTVLAALGRTIATAVNAIENRRLLIADERTGLTITLDDPTLFFVDLSDRLDCRLTYRGSLYGTDGRLRAFFIADPPLARSTTNDVLAEHRSVVDVQPIGDRNPRRLYEFVLGPAGFFDDLAERGVRITAIDVTDGTARIELELSAAANPRSFVSWITDRYRNVGVVAYRNRVRPATTDREFGDRVRTELTDRQLMALQKAYLSGYYDPTRPITGTELAESMDISRSTFHQHLRAAERKVLSRIFDEGSDPDQ